MRSAASFLFSKYTGCGNDFVMVDNREGSFPSANRERITKVCHRHQGVGADGLILLEYSKVADFKMRYFNADGGEAEMCGNGLRCLGKFLLELGFPKKTSLIEFGNRKVAISYKDDLICIDLYPPSDFLWNITIPTTTETFKGHFLNTGVPHVVVFVPNLENVDVLKVGREIRHHALFAPKGTNVNFVSSRNPRLLEMRTFERGVEGETLACGSGATAAAIAYAHEKGLQGPFQVKTRSQEIIEIHFEKEHQKINNLQMIGPARQIFKGIYLAEEVVLENPVENCVTISVQ